MFGLKRAKPKSGVHVLGEGKEWTPPTEFDLIKELNAQVARLATIMTILLGCVPISPTFSLATIHDLGKTVDLRRELVLVDQLDGGRIDHLRVVVLRE
jgi:hypothetical protein